MGFEVGGPDDVVAALDEVVVDDAIVEVVLLPDPDGGGRL